MENLEMRKWVLQYVKIRGYSITADATEKLVSMVGGVREQTRLLLMRTLMLYLQKINFKTPVICVDHIKSCVEQCVTTLKGADKLWNVINIFEVPKYYYSHEVNKVIKDDSTNLKDMFSDGLNKILSFSRRYNLIMQRILRHDLFRQQKELGGENPSFFLKTVEWFLCCPERIENAILVGLLVQKNETVYAIEDLTGSLELDISKAKFHDGFFLEHSFVIVEGFYEEQIFYVQGIGFPPAEPASKTKPYYGIVDSFGDHPEDDQSDYLTPNFAETNPDARIVFISDVWLDKAEVLEKLNTLLCKFNLDPPVAIIFIGNFLYTHDGPQNADKLQTGLKSLGEMIAEARNVASKSHIVLVPGPSDLGAPHILPRPPLPEVLCTGLKTLVPHAVLATNPCKIQYSDKEIIIIREDLISKMCRNTINLPKTGDIQMHFVRTIISQGNLAPLSLNVCPVYWNYSHCLDIYPLPDLIVTADQFKAFTVEHMECSVVNPGMFMKGGFSFRVYLPQSGKVEECSALENSHEEDEEYTEDGEN